MTPTRPGPRNADGFLGPRLVAALLVGLAVVLIISALGISRGAGYTVVGPQTIPLVVAIGLLIMGLVFGLRTTVRPDADMAAAALEEERVTHWPSVLLAAGALLVYAMALDGIRLGGVKVPGLGFLVATAVFLPVVARILGSRSPLRDLVVGVVMASVLYVAFTEYLGVRLPPGLLDFVF
ncbi:MAG: tripartite tricarboxylate transporter TctB family protein [Chloroflexota bacterium]